MPDVKQRRVVLYCRVSTTGQTTENQKRDLLKYAEQRTWSVVKVFEDVGISGAKDSRPALDDLMQQARKRQFDIVVVWKFDRFARSTQHLLAALEEFRTLGVDFVSFSEGIDTSSAMGKLVFTFLAAVAEFERSLIKERIAAGLRRAKATGVRLGRPRRGFDVNTAFGLKRGGLSWQELAKKVGVPVATLRRTLTPLLKTPEAPTA